MTHYNSFLKSSMKYGLYYAIISIVILMITWATKMQETMGYTGNVLLGITSAAISVFILVYFTKNFRDTVLDGSIVYKQAFLVGLLTVVFGSIILALYNFSFNTWIDPEYSQRIIDALHEKTFNMLNSFGATEDQIEETLKKFEGMKAPTPVESMVGSLQNGLIVGAILSLISSAIVKKNKAESGYEAAMKEIDDEE
jgi:hypothetical protein